MELIYNNYMRASGSGYTFRVDIDAPVNKTPDYLQECLDVAEYIYEHKQGKLYLMYSGGVDSEFVLNVFLQLGIDVVPVIIKLTPGYNDHDVKYAFDFCSSKGLKPLVVDIDFDQFVKSATIVDIAKDYYISTYQLPSTFHCLSKLEGTVIMGSHSLPHVSKDIATGIWYVDEHQPIWTCLEYFKRNGLYGCPFFLSYTAEQHLAGLQHPTMMQLANNQIPGKLGSNSSKCDMFNDFAKFNMPARPKFTGYENIEKSPIFQHENLQIFKEFEKQWWGVHREPFFDMLARMQA